jgi:hypothetical protein
MYRFMVLRQDGGIAKKAVAFGSQWLYDEGVTIKDRI